MSYGYPPPQQPGQPQQPGPQQVPQWGQQPPPPGQYPPQQGPGWGGPTPMPPPKKTNKGGLIAVLGCSGVLVLALIGGVVALASSGGSSHGEASGSSSVAASPSGPVEGKAPAKEEPAPKEKGAEADVSIKACTVEPTTTWPAADLEIVNHSGSKANYIVMVEFVGGDGTRLGEGMASANSLAPGQKAKEKAQGLAETSGKVTCKVSKVSRYPAG